MVGDVVAYVVLWCAEAEGGEGDFGAVSVRAAVKGQLLVPWVSPVCSIMAGLCRRFKGSVGLFR